MSRAKHVADWLETHWIAPAYSGWLIGGLTVFFFIAATNTMAGWLYVLSGIGFALLAIAAVLPERILRNIQVYRNPIHPVSVGDQLTIELVLKNPTRQSKTLIQVQDMLPSVLGQPVSVAVENIAAHGTYQWVYFQPTQQRGIYHWKTVNLRTAAPLGLFWCQRSRSTKATAIVYPTVLPLTQCPLVDEMGRDRSLQFNSDRRSHSATEGLTRSLRPYRYGDPTRLIHWRSSARYGELRVRELEVLTGGQEFIICLDSAQSWHQKPGSHGMSDDFEQAVIAAASLYCYARHRKLSVRLWTPGTGLIYGSKVVLETLAGIQFNEEQCKDRPTLPLIWLTQNPASLNTLPPGSRWILWSTVLQQRTPDRSPTLQQNAGIVINSEQSLQQQLQGQVRGVGEWGVGE